MEIHFLTEKLTDLFQCCIGVLKIYLFEEILHVQTTLIDGRERVGKIGVQQMETGTLLSMKSALVNVNSYLVSLFMVSS